MPSEIQICNLAISWLGGQRITSFGDETAEAILCYANYELARDAVLERIEWSFAIKRVILPPLADAPVFGTGFSQFVVPPDCLRVLSCSSDTNDNRTVYWKYEDRKILAPLGQVYVRYLARITDPASFSPMFVYALASKIAADISVPLTASKELKLEYKQLYELTLSQAAMLDGKQGAHEKTRSSTLKAARWSLTPYSTGDPAGQ